jgi:hypothetical protein
VTNTEWPMRLFLSGYGAMWGQWAGHCREGTAMKVHDLGQRRRPRSCRRTRSPGRNATGTLSLALLLICLSQAQVRAQQSCVNPAVGVPPFGGPPDWLAAGQPSYADSIHDPRWQGALAMTYGSGTAGQVEFRALSDASFLYLSWHMRINESFDSDGDVLRVVFGTPSGTPTVGQPDVRIEIKPLKAKSGADFMPPKVNQSVLTQTRIRTSLTGTWSPVATEPAWLTNAHAWVNTDNSWAVNMKVPRLSAGGPGTGIAFATNGNLRLWYEVQMKTTAANFVRYTWPRQLPSTIDPSSIEMAPWNRRVPAMPATAAGCPAGTSCFWLDMASNPVPAASELHLAGGSSSAVVCSDVGVSLAYDMVGAYEKLTDPTAQESSKIRYRALNPKPVNTFFARPFNKSGMTIPMNGIRAFFRIADWGSSPNPEQAAPGAQLWMEVPGTTGGIGNSTLISDMSLASLTNITFDWTVVDVAANPFLTNLINGDMPEHQCLFVELTSALPITFVNNSVYRNMDFVAASKFQRGAAISVVGLAPIGGSHRDVYLFVETQNMPRRASRASRYPVPARPDTASDEAPHRRMQSSGASDSLIPTYRVHAFHDTGERETDAGTTYSILEPQSSFGYYVRHDGEVEGWRHSLTGAQLIELAPNFYKLAVRDNGVATVTTTIEALEPMPFALSLHAGLSLPHGALSNTHDPGFGLTIDGKQRLNATFAAVGLLGYHHFTGAVGNTDLDLYHASGGLEAVLTSGKLALLAEAGGGGYHFSPGGTDPGAHAGLGLEFDVSPQVVLGVSYRVHTVFTSGSNTTFSSIQAGGRFRF